MVNQGASLLAVTVGAAIGVYLGWNPKTTKEDKSKERPKAGGSNELGSDVIVGSILATYTEEGTRRPVKLNSTYGTPEDFQNAVVELRNALPSPEESVSIEPDNLLSHGASMNDYHPGK